MMTPVGRLVLCARSTKARGERDGPCHGGRAGRPGDRPALGVFPSPPDFSWHWMGASSSHSRSYTRRHLHAQRHIDRDPQRKSKNGKKKAFSILRAGVAGIGPWRHRVRGLVRGLTCCRGRSSQTLVNDRHHLDDALCDPSNATASPVLDFSMAAGCRRCAPASSGGFLFRLGIGGAAVSTAGLLMQVGFVLSPFKSGLVLCLRHRRHGHEERWSARIIKDVRLSQLM